MSGRLLPACLVSLLATIASGEESPDRFVDFSRDVAPILASNCYQCHGPDANHREAGLRLDVASAATTQLDSGETAVVAGSLTESALWQRIISSDPDLRMPPADSDKILTTDQRATIQRWIVQGAHWSQHWSLTRPVRPSAPRVQQTSWPSNSIDRFILAALEQNELTPSPDADRYTLIRRVCLDLIGLPPTPQEIERFVEDASPYAYEQLVDRLLSSPHYGERWGRHWLDVARYGDSNGGDENHAYPLAFRYRDYVIRAWNADLPYRRFIDEQIAGDLLPASNDPLADAHRLSATGFLAIGMKILAEQDPVKKRADMVDEQIDTVGRALLGLSLGCARCHDHKFDPVTTADYYALAGILHSTDVGDRPLETPAYLEAQADHERRVAGLKANRQRAELLLEQTLAASRYVQRQAEQFERGNVSVDREGYGKEIGIISDPGGGQTNFVEYDFQLETGGEYVIQLRYAAQQPRPGPLMIDGRVLREDAMAQVTGGWQPEHQRWITEATCLLQKGLHTLRLESEPTMVHIDRWRVVLSDSQHTFDEVAKLDEQLAELAKQAPQPTQVMAVSEGTTRNVRIHRRGSHLDLGAEVPRRFIDSLSRRSAKLPDDQSGRRELARWLVDDRQGAGFLAARVIVNRVWHWHFGRGLVETPDDFGTRGQRSTHPRLLDDLTHHFIDSGWSIKSLHRWILASRTYQMSSQHRRSDAQQVDPENRLYWHYPLRRLEPEVIRDAMLQLSGQLDRRMFGEPPAFKSQDPSPQDLASNRASYERSRRRSVYLPVVRTNVYQFLTLFDFPNASAPVGRRDETTVPTQALFLMNSPYVAENCRHIARSLIGHDMTGPATIRELHLAIIGRAPTSKQVAVAEQFLAQYRVSSDQRAGQGSASSESAEDAWIALCHTLLMSNQFVYMY